MSNLRMLSPRFQRFINSFILLLGIYIVLYVLNVPFHLGIYMSGEHGIIVYGAVLLLIFMMIPMRAKDQEKLPWYDIALGIGSVISCIYLAWFWRDLAFGFQMPTGLKQTFAAILLLATLEAARRTLGKAFMIIGFIFILYPLLGSYFPGFLFTRKFEFERLADIFYASGSGIFSSSMNLFATIVVMFMIFGAFINSSKASDFLMNLGTAAAGGYRGGSAKVSVLSSSIFGSLSGVGAANVVATGTFTIPFMKSQGFKGTRAAAIEATASSGGVIMPPIMGAAAFLMADFLQIPYHNIIIAAFLPALFYYVALFLIVDSLAAKENIRGIEKEKRPTLKGTMKKGGHFITPVAILVFCLVYLNYSAELSAFYATLGLVAVSYLRRETRMTLREMKDALISGVTSFLKLAPAAAIVGIIMASVDMTGLSVTLASGLIDLSGGNVVILLILIALASIIMGMGASPLMVYILLVVLLVPALVEMGVMPLAAHLFIFYFSMAALITPPTGLSVIMAAGIAKVPFWPTAWESVRLSIIVFIIPFVFVFDPSLLMQGDWVQIGYTFITTSIGVIALAGGLTGYLIVGEIKWVSRILLIASTILLSTPLAYLDLIGLLCLIIPIFELNKGVRGRSYKLKETIQ